MNKTETLIEQIAHQQKTIQSLETEVTCLNESLREMKVTMDIQLKEIKHNFEKQKEYMIDGIKQILLILESEKKSNEKYVSENTFLRQQNHLLTLENHSLKMKISNVEEHYGVI